MADNGIINTAFGMQGWVRSDADVLAACLPRLTDPRLIAAITDGTVRDRETWRAWWDAHRPRYDYAAMGREQLGYARPTDPHAPDYWHTAALDGGAL